jgi:hypothetical protein
VQPYWYYRDPHDYYVAGQDDQPRYLHHEERDNPAAITGFSFGICALGLFLISGGIAFLATIPCSIVGIVVGRRGIKAVDQGDATRHRRYAKAGFVTGIVTLVLSTIWALIFIAAAIFPDEFDDPNRDFSVLSGVRLVVLVGRSLFSAVS